ncbi:MAG TPA: TIGR00296 family protein [Thermoplasmata archaeon]
MRYSDEEGQLAVRVAREALEAFVEGRAMRSFEIPRTFEEKAGAFVTLNLHPSGELRGCIGYPEPFFPLLKSIVRGAEGAAEDPRFPPVRPEELRGIAVEVSLLTPPQPVEVKKPRDLPKRIDIGTDGIIVAQGPYRGLFLPQVAIENHMDAETFLSECCMKAGLLPDAWFEPTTRVKKFQAEIFAELEPRGPVTRRKLDAEHARP